MATISLSIPEKPQTFIEILMTGYKIGKAALQALLPFTTMLALLGYVMQPTTKPTFIDTVDMMTLGLFILGCIALLILHASTVHRLYEILKGNDESFFIALKMGFKKAIGLFAVVILYFTMMILGLALFVCPFFYLATVFCFAPFLIVIDEDKRPVSFYERVKRSFVDSFQLVKGNFWRTFGVLFSLIIAGILSETMLQIVLQHHIVLANLIIVLFRIFFLIFWYGCMIALMCDLKQRTCAFMTNTHTHKHSKRRAM